MRRTPEPRLANGECDALANGSLALAAGGSGLRGSTRPAWPLPQPRSASNRGVSRSIGSDATQSRAAGLTFERPWVPALKARSGPALMEEARQ